MNEHLGEYARSKKERKEIPVNDMGLTRDEKVCHDKLMECYQSYSKLENQHPSDIDTFIEAIHSIQALLALRIARRHYPEGWKIEKDQLCADCPISIPSSEPTTSEK